MAFPSPELLAWLATSSLYGSAAILLVLVLTPALRRVVGAQAAFLLWAVVLGRLLVPGLPDSPVGWSPAPTPTTPLVRVASANDADLPARATPPVPLAARETIASPSTGTLPWGWIWALGAGVMLGLSVTRAGRARRLVGSARDVTGDPLVRQAVPAWPRRLRVRETDACASPALAGLWHPTILLPADWRTRFSQAELACVLQHEIGHWRRGDLIWRWAFLLARAVHWFNPLVWIAERAARVDQELACDEWVLTRRHSPGATAYGEALLRALRRSSVPHPMAPGHAGMAETRAGLRRRMRHVAGVRPRPAAGVALTLILAPVALVLTGPARTESRPPSEPTSPASASPPPPKIASKDGAKAPAAPLVTIEARFVQLPSAAAEELFRDQAGGDSLAVQAIFSRAEFEPILRKILATPRADVLSVPRVTTRSGHPARIEVIREFRYPQRFERDNSPSGASPAEFATRNVGVEMGVLATVAPDGSIALELTPRVTDFEGFVNYAGGAPRRAGTGDDALTAATRPDPQAETALNQPVFSTRSAVTSLTLRNGETAFVAGFGAPIPGRSDHPKPATELTVFCFLTATIDSPR